MACFIFYKFRNGLRNVLITLIMYNEPVNVAMISLLPTIDGKKSGIAVHLERRFG
jgi:hypothetical protein